jgi:hypothetical protein
MAVSSYQDEERASERWPWPVAVLAFPRHNPPNSKASQNCKISSLTAGPQALNPIQLLFSGPTGPVDKGWAIKVIVIPEISKVIVLGS